MAEKEFQQLRFDISEKVTLHPQQPGIGTLLELNLLPDVEIKDEGQHLRIHGFLRLNGLYLGDEVHKDEQEVHLENLIREEIAYVIPVEITLPANRAEPNYVSAEVESFDYSVLSPFELQIEAILLIDGLLPEVETTEADKLAFSASPAKVAYLAEGDQNEEELPAEELVSYSPVEEEIVSKETKIDFSMPTSKEMDTSDEEEKMVAKKSPIQLQDEAIEEDHEHEDKEELFRQEKAELEEEQEGLDWIRWLVRGKGETFKPMRMVIVQKGESVEYLADRFGVSKDQLIEVNQLNSDYIEEGEILYIPQSRRIGPSGN
ncbi:LysM peptidoglycan-binding domain-containing protein [Thermoflavimicrobium daqui]|uniref:LysM domain-containing protein n=1 Tax=Thermoflavimicrobium daqui TaxID=2137476 RepID=A0A364K8N8_9BACL|nr:LysM peptidoglycan-binding domain-containing protein [Thermoflavimicrobium daqui]RAL26666.1 hypothetical protein DL897_01040 [Thermoflavimicrobium daqui]